jgi:hypothetical protein
MPFGSVPVGYEDDTPGIGDIGPEGGRPRTHASHYGTNDGLGGRDPLGIQGMKGGFDSDNENVNEESEKIDNTLAKSMFHRNKDLFKNKKQIIFEKKEELEDNLLDESQIKDLDN